MAAMRLGNLSGHFALGPRRSLRPFTTSSSQHSIPLDPTQCLPWKITAVHNAINSGFLSEAAPLAMFWNVNVFKETLKEAHDAFPKHWIHTIAAKANPLMSIFKVASQVGAGCECASLGELTQAIKAGFPSEKIVFDSPTKTLQELKIALKHNVLVNVDNFQELDRLDELVKEEEKKIGRAVQQECRDRSRMPSSA
eukprot:TRINITY_DN39052_c0_g1_i1.p1 TRINITY_DN39052_c0_g1~~TRINITY_DN39052_c0_g1_i1.p1  ORF type:complete len:196 (-),score=27.33 TRINITY_DN39052_c0_g1_i1:17-604(-)